MGFGDVGGVLPPHHPILYCFWFGALGQGHSPGWYFNNYLTVDLCVIYKVSNKEEATEDRKSVV